MEPHKQHGTRDGQGFDRLDSAPTADEAKQKVTDWRELGRRVLNEAARRSMRELRRRNGCTPNAHKYGHGSGGLS